MFCRSVPAAFLLLSAAILLLSACSSASQQGAIGEVWPFATREQERSKTPPNSTEYRCEGGKQFYVRFAGEKGSAWVILPEREFRLDKAATGYRNATTALEFKGDEASLTDGAALNYTGCKVPPRP